MRITITENQLNNLIDEQLTQPTGTTNFADYIKKFETVKLNNKTFTPDDFLTRLNNSPIQLNMYHIQTDGLNIGTGSVSVTGRVKNFGIRLNVKPVGDYKVGLVTITKTI
jgi:hypothetical protein